MRRIGSLCIRNAWSGLGCGRPRGGVLVSALCRCLLNPAERPLRWRKQVARRLVDASIEMSSVGSISSAPTREGEARGGRADHCTFVRTRYDAVTASQSCFPIVIRKCRSPVTEGRDVVVSVAWSPERSPPDVTSEVLKLDSRSGLCRIALALRSRKCTTAAESVAM